MIAFSCPQCNKALKVPDDYAGKQAKCPGCGNLVAVPRQARPGQDLRDILAPAQQPGEIGRLGPFRVLQVLGTGGMGVVYKAEDPQLKRLVAIKAMLPSLAASEAARQRFVREGQAAAAVVHDHIVPILQVGEDRGVPFMAMPFLEGEPLDVRLKRDSRLPVAEVLRIGREVAEGLGAAHDRGLIHRDVKPANIWLEGKKGRVKILDFGLARGAGGDDVHLTKTGTFVGTPAYMAPEQAQSEKVDHRCDLFSLGAVLYQLLTGELPFKGHDTMSVLMALAMDTPPSPRQVNREVPAELSDLVMGMLAKEPAGRPKSAHVVAEALRAMEVQSKTPTSDGNLWKQVVAEPNQIVEKLPLARSRKEPANGATRMEAKSPAPGRPAKKRLPLPWLVGSGVLGLGVLVLLIVFLARPGGNQVQREPPVPKDGAAVTMKAESLPPMYKNGIGMEFVLVPKGKSWLGGGGGKFGDKDVEIPHDFYLGKYEVTQEEWEKVTGINPSHFSRKGAGKEAVQNIRDAELKRLPVETVSWNDAQMFLKLLNAQAKERGWAYRLPKESEWEYACRGGQLTDRFDSAFDFYLDKPINQLQPTQANFAHGTPVGRTSKVGSYQPNRQGLYDMHGNVWEWCADAENGADGTTLRVSRGGCWFLGPTYCQAASRSFLLLPSFRNHTVGLRVARVPVTKEGVSPQPPQPHVEEKAETPRPTFKNTLGMEFVLAPKGKSWLGGGGGKPGDKEVEIAHAFYLGKYEVTQEEWEKVTGINPSYFSLVGAGKQAVQNIPDAELERFPVEVISWNDAQLFLKLLNLHVKEAGWVYRLPKEAEWEYACRGGPMTDKSQSGFDFYCEKPTNQLLPGQALFGKGPAGRTCKVGSYQPNLLGLYDFHGNVSEWCDTGDKEGSQPFLRGGGYYRESDSCRASVRSPATAAAYGDPATGLRVARVPVGKETVVPPPAERNADAPPPKLTIKEVMKIAHVGKTGPPGSALITKVANGAASKEDKETLLAAYVALSQNKPPQGDLDEWKTKTEAIVKALKEIIAQETAGTNPLKVAVNCKVCHTTFKPK